MMYSFSPNTIVYSIDSYCKLSVNRWWLVPLGGTDPDGCVSHDLGRSGHHDAVMADRPGCSHPYGSLRGAPRSRSDRAQDPPRTGDYSSPLFVCNNWIIIGGNNLDN